MQKPGDQLQAVQQLTKIGNAHFLDLGSDAQFSDRVPHGRLLVRECCVGLSKELHDYLMGPGHIFIVVGSPVKFSPNKELGSCLSTYAL